MTSKYADRELAWAEIAMKLDLCETGIANASLCHGYYVRDGITTALINQLNHIFALWRTT